ncbi:MAG: endonuclease MutS2 [Deltaproteobacteria bacterium]|nr:endonuclease MutS2 [Deltaproteobacteria bacterium]MBW2071124.1 endonuclease MutS2 [Deltaproteobacteria bacterium]
MDYQSLRVVEFPFIVKCLVALCRSEPGRRRSAELRPGDNRLEIEKLLAQVSELKEYLQVGNDLPLFGIEPVGDILEQVEGSGQSLQPESLLKIASTLEATQRLHSLARQCAERYHRLLELLEQLEPLAELLKTINKTVDHRGWIRDDASPELARLRGEIITVREQLHKELSELLDRLSSQKILQDKLITVRNDRLVIPLRSEARGAIEGIVHDTSHKGATSFVEPLSAVPLNNKLCRARALEKEEEARILRQLTEKVLGKASILRLNEYWLGHIDSVHAKVLLSRLLGGREPELNNGQRIRLKEAAHPILILQEKAQEPGGLPAVLRDCLPHPQGEKRDDSRMIVVANDFELSREKSMLIISGANTGGKTVSLKTLGLLGAMIQAGLHVPVAEGSEWPVFSNIFAEIGDEQDLQAHLSTFSARIKRIVEVLQHADADTLVLFDEIGTGTDPAEGAALALAVMDELLERRVFAVVTTHYHLIKAYGAGRANVENVAVEFDGETGRPTYRLLYGTIGSSNALKVAADLSLPSRVLQRTERYLEPNSRWTVELIEGLAKARRRAESQLVELEKERQQLQRLRSALAREQEQLQSQREAILEETRVQASLLLSEADKEIRAMISDFQRSGAPGAQKTHERLKQVKESVSAVLKQPKPEKSAVLPPFAAGRRVRLSSTAATGTILRLKEGGRRAEVQIGQKRVEVAATDLEVLATDEDKHSPSSSGIKLMLQPRDGYNRHLDLVGLRVEEALAKLDKAIDQAILEDCSSIYVIHGHGTGKLRQAVHGFLMDHALVKGFRHERQSQGGTGVTVVELKE